MKFNAPGGLPPPHFLNLLKSQGLSSEHGFEEISRFCILADGMVKHYSNCHDKKNRIVIPTTTTCQQLIS